MLNRIVGGKLLLDAKLRKLPSLEFRRDPAFLGFIFPYVLSSAGEYVAHLVFDWRNPAGKATEDETTGAENVVGDGPVDKVLMVLIAKGCSCCPRLLRGSTVG